MAVVRDGKSKRVQDTADKEWDIIQAETLILECISKRIKTVKEEVQLCIDKCNEDIGIKEKQYMDLLEFEDKHKEELKGIYHLSPFGSFGRPFSSYFHFVLDEISQCIKCDVDDCERIKQKKGLFEGEYVLITYEDFEKDTGLSSKTIKKYLKIMCIKGTVKRQRAIFGYVYTIPENK